MDNNNKHKVHIMTFISRTALASLLSVSAVLLAACSPAENEAGSAASTTAGEVHISHRLSLAIYLDDEGESMTPGQQFQQSWPFDVPVKRADDDEVEIVKNCSQAIAAYERGQMPVEETDHKAFRQAVFFCYSAEMVASFDGVQGALDAPVIDESWLASLPAAVSPAAFIDEPESLLEGKRRWTDLSSVVSIGLEEPGLALVETESQFQVINVLARGALGGGSAEDLLIFSVASSPADGPEEVRLFLLGRDEGSTNFEVIRAF